MKRMIRAFAVLSVVGALFAFSPKSDNYCYYKLNSNNVCAFFDYSVNKTITSTTGGTEDVIDIPAQDCPATRAQADCQKQVTESFD